MKKLIIALAFICIAIPAEAKYTNAEILKIVKEAHSQIKKLNVELEASYDEQDKVSGQIVKIQTGIARDHAVAEKLTAENKKLDREVWIYKGSATVFIMLLIGYLLFKTGIIAKIIPLAMTLAAPWGEIALIAGIPLFITGLFALIWHFLP